jgi:hypothetical protein
MATEETAPTGRPRSWLLIVLALAVIGLVASWMWPTDSTGLASPSSNAGAQTPGRRDQKKADPADLQVRLDDLKAPRPELGPAERNPFRFQPKPPPPPPPETARPAVPSGPPPVTGPPPPPPIPLKFIGIVEEKQGGLKVAAMSDCRSTYYGSEGQVIDGRYRLIKIGVESMVIEYVDGRGRTTVRLEGCPAR